MVRSVLVLLLMFGTHEAFATDFCDGWLKIEEETISKFKENAPFYIRKNENPEINCILYIQIIENEIFLKPDYVRFTFKELGLKENPMQIKAKSRKTRWKVKAFYENVHMYETKVVVDTKNNDFIKLVTPRVTAQNFSVEIDTIFAPETTKIPQSHRFLLGHCGLSLRQVKIKQCTKHPMRLSCKFECRDGYFPLFIDESIYPAFTGICETGRTQNWPQESDVCVSPEAVVRDCLSGALLFRPPGGTYYTGSDLEDCPYDELAVMKWFGEMERTSNESYSAFKKIAKLYPEECYSIAFKTAQETESPCDTECDIATINGVRTYSPQCFHPSKRSNWQKCMVCRHPASSSPCKRLKPL